MESSYTKAVLNWQLLCQIIALLHNVEMGYPARHFKTSCNVFVDL